MLQKNTCLYIIVPCYNEEAVLDHTVPQLENKLNQLIKSSKVSEDSRVLFIDDGSSDNTWNKLEKLVTENSFFKAIKLSRNFGHQNALLAGLTSVTELCDCCITIDADLQDDLEAIDKMIENFLQGSDVVYGVRSSRDTDSFVKKSTANLFYRLMKFLGAETVHNHADFRLLSKKALELLKSFNEVNLFLRGLVTIIGLKNSVVYYERKKRDHGVTKYPFSKMLSFAFEGITSFSIVPLRIVSAIGALIFILSFIMSLNVFYEVYVSKTAIHGWASTVLPMWFLGGIQLMSIGLLGEYIGKIYKEVKGRPRFLIEKEIV